MLLLAANRIQTRIVVLVLVVLLPCVHLLVSDSRVGSSAPIQQQGASKKGHVEHKYQTMDHLEGTYGARSQQSAKVANGQHQTIGRSNTKPDQHQQHHEEIYLESIEDLDHLSYLALRNYNLTDDRLLQSTWLMGSGPLGNALNPHNHQKESASALSTDGNYPKGRLALMLESLLLHLRNGHLKRMSLEELQGLTTGQNLTESLEKLRQGRQSSVPLDTNARYSITKKDGDDEPQFVSRDSNDANINYQDAVKPSPTTQDLDEDQDPDSLDFDGELRCLHLVTLYRYDLGERSKAQSVSQSKVEYENSAAQQQQNETSLGAQLQPEPGLASSTSGEQLQSAGINSSVVTANATFHSADMLAASSVDQVFANKSPDEMRLMNLCKLAVNCRTSEELVHLISKPWKANSNNIGEGLSGRRLEPRDTMGHSANFLQYENLERESVPSDRDDDQLEQMNSQQQLADDNRLRRKNLRDSLSLSLAKLCPLILFPLHEDDGRCMVRRDDRPPMVTVWAFATLFVTIVCFCSLIGLSITPLLGYSATADTSTGADSSETSAPAFKYLPSFLFGPTNSGRGLIQSKQQGHRASLMLFEGLAVGSLVGSALFSLIPQAFELQERESNQSFLLKAFIIFSGIYLFFLSERIMRIILDARQKRKRKKRNTHRSSTTAAAEMPPDAHHQHMLVPSGAGPQMLNHPTDSGTNTGPSFGPNSLFLHSSQGRPSTSSNGGCRKHLKSRNKQHSKIAKTGDKLPLDSASPMMANGKRTTSVLQRPSGPASQQATVASGGISKSSAHSSEHKSKTKTMRDIVAESRQEKISTSAPTASKKLMGSERRRSRQPNLRRQLRATNMSSDVQEATTTRSNQQLNRKSRRQRRCHQLTSKRETVRQQQRAARRVRRVTESDPDYHLDYQSTDSSSSGGSNTCSLSQSSSSFASYALDAQYQPRMCRGGILGGFQKDDDSQMDYSSSSSHSHCSSCSSYGRDLCGTINLSDSDDENGQRRAVSRRMNELSRRWAEQKRDLQQQQMLQADPVYMMPRTTFRFDQASPEPLPRTPDLMQDGHQTPMSMGVPSYTSRHGFDRSGSSSNQTKQDISTVAWMIILGDGLHNFIDGISIGAAFSESILSGISISVAVICEEFPHELGDFAVLVSSGMTVRQALGYNFLSACTCYLGMAVGIILGDVTDGASYISALAAGVFLYIALVDMMGELSAALEASSRDSIARTLKLLLLQNVGIAIGISIIFVLSFIDF